MSNKPNPKSVSDQPMVYQLRIKGHLGSHRTGLLEGISIQLESNSDTLYTNLEEGKSAAN